MAEQTVSEVLERAADLLAPEGAWTQGTWARDASGRSVTLWSDNAVRFCMRGALVRTAKVSMSADLPKIQKALGFTSASKMARWNDRETRTQAEVVAKLREAALVTKEPK